MPTFEAARGDYEFVDAHGVTIHYYAWKAAKPRGVVQIAHGVGEYALRYEELAETTWSGPATPSTPTTTAGTGRPASGSGARAAGCSATSVPAASARRWTRSGSSRGLIRAEAEGVPVILLGHSWGSLMAQILVDAHADDFDGVVLTGTAYRTPRTMNGGDLNKRHAHLGTTGFEWLSRDPAVAAGHGRRPARRRGQRAQAVRAARRAAALRAAREEARARPAAADQVGSDDPLGGTASAEKLAHAYLNRSRLTDVELIVYDGARHEVFNETNREEVIADLVDWLDDESLCGR